MLELPTAALSASGGHGRGFDAHPKMILETKESGDELNLAHWRNDYVGIEQYSAFAEDGRTPPNAKSSCISAGAWSG